MRVMPHALRAYQDIGLRETMFVERSVRPWQIIAGLLALLAAVVMPDSDADAYPHIDKTEALLYEAANIPFRPCAILYSVSSLRW